jgi:hypothetical protein
MTFGRPVYGYTSRMADFPERTDLPVTGVEKAQDERELTFLYDRHPGIPKENIDRRYAANKRGLMRSSKIRFLIPALALKITNRQLLDGQTEITPEMLENDEAPMVGFEESLDQRDLDRLFERFADVDRQQIVDMYTRNKETLSVDATIRDFIPVLAMNITSDQLKGRPE